MLYIGKLLKLNMPQSKEKRKGEKMSQSIQTKLLGENVLFKGEDMVTGEIAGEDMVTGEIAGVLLTNDNFIRYIIRLWDTGELVDVSASKFTIVSQAYVTELRRQKS